MPTESSKTDYKRNILIAVAGHTPAIITETLWALEQRLGVRVDAVAWIRSDSDSKIVLTSPDSRQVEGQLPPHPR